MKARPNPARPIAAPSGFDDDDDMPFEEWALDEADSVRELLPAHDRRHFDAAFD